MHSLLDDKLIKDKGKGKYILETNKALKIIANYQLNRRKQKIDITLQVLIVVLSVPIATNYIIQIVLMLK